MTVAPSWGMSANVLALVDNMTGKTTAQIDEIIAQCEGFFSTMLKLDSFTFTSMKVNHLYLRQCVELRAALICLTPDSMHTVRDAALKLDQLFEMYMSAIKFLIGKEASARDAINAA